MSFLDLSPSPVRTGRACAWIEQDGRILMAARDCGGWTLPGGGIHPGESPALAAVREAWEECGAHAEVAGEPVILHSASGIDSLCFPLRLASPALEPSPEGRPVAWIDPRVLPWADDMQLRQVLRARGETPQHLDVPPLVAQADSEAAKVGFDRSCSLEVGRLLRVLATSRPAGRLLELGTGLGAGSAWLLAGMDPSARLLTVENDPDRALMATRLLQHDSRAEVLHGDWTGALAHGPFDLIFADCAPAKGEAAQLDRLLEALCLGGVLVLDNFTPPTQLPAALYGGDAAREALFGHAGLSCAEVQVSARECVLLATRRA
ncbi:NUDIX domain-containing protein [Deinococcus deserti]|uniref:Putative NUDIX hydrolase/O-methyltransferase domains protein n=1 Tax=Deinococcus deserti (strain DSM 17065 / CIP 109153 / LMG 22923 / VCD115) TaxID=546414 RepID=C1CZN7_DEIDV|nr:NUDIX domain-containing protein [Deinococcus deserti]ACO47285.1 putative NUDIX hydrolase/O-methyltransferase domains protein [Deinococcus deserti VCD115]